MKNFLRLLLMLSFLSIMTACQPALKEFQPEKDSLFKIIFSYPASWKWEKDRPYDELPPGEVPPLSERIILKNEEVSIQVFKTSNPQAKMQEWMDAYLGAVAAMLRADTTFEIGGYNARWLTVVYPPQNTSEGDVDEGIYLLAEDRFYILDLHIPESEINGRLDKEFKELIKTIKILP